MQHIDGADAGHAAGAVEERKAFAKMNFERLDAELLKDPFRRLHSTIVPYIALADEAEREVGKLHQIAGSADPAVRIHAGISARIDERYHYLYELRMHAAIAKQHSIKPCEHCGPHL